MSTPNYSNGDQQGERNIEPNSNASLFPSEDNEGASGRSKRMTWGLILFVMVLAIGGGSFAWFTGKLDDLADRYFPLIVQVKGRITLDGKPLTDGFIQTLAIDHSMPGMLGPIEKDGTFELTLDSGPGAYSGRHRVIVSLMTKTFPPKSLIPSRYTDATTTPLIIRIPRRDNGTVLLLELTSDPESPEQPKLPQETKAPVGEAGPKSTEPKE